MCSLKVLTVLLLANCVFAGSLFRDCAKNSDEEICRKEGLKRFFTEFSGGNAEKGIKVMDPMVLGHIDVPEEALDLMFHYKQFKVTGLKDVVITKFEKLQDKNEAHMTLKFNYLADGPLDVEFTKTKKVLTGTVKYEGGVTGDITYPFSLVTENGKEVPVLGPETISCESTLAKSTVSDDLRNALENNPDSSAMKDEYLKIHSNHQAKVVCETAKAVFKVVVENLRALIRSETH